MIALKILVNEEPYATIGQEDWAVLTAGIAATTDGKSDESIRFNLGGLSRQNVEGVSHHFRWPALNLNLKDIVSIEVIETSVVDPPIRRYRSDKEVKENPFTEKEQRDMRYQDYLQLKNEFENT